MSQTTRRTGKRSVPWWNNECRKARKKQNKAWGLLRNSPTAENLINFKLIKSQGRRTRRQARRDSWQRFISGVNSYRDEAKVWKSVNKIRGQPMYPVPLVDTQGESLEDQADSLGAYFEAVSSSAHYSESFQRYKTRLERQRLERISTKNEAYNEPFRLAELRAALNCCNKSAPGTDRILYDMLKHLSQETQQTLLSLYNAIWFSCKIPTSWKEAIVIPVPKQGKDPSSVNSYRPIALTSCLCKLFEKMINCRLIHFLESNKLLDPRQCGFREGRSTIDHLVRIEAQIREAFIHKQFFLSVFLDLEKAYDTTWRYGILRDLSHLGVRGRMLDIIESYLSDRTFRVRVGDVLSRTFVQETGVPQGGVLSCTLFIVKMNSLRLHVPRNMFYCAYVDDVQIGFKSCNLAMCERQVQLGLNKIAKWADDNGFRLNPQKSTCVLFSRKRGLHPDPGIYLQGQRLSVKTEHKFLGVILDAKLTFVSYIKYLRNKCMTTINILKVLSRTTWGSDRKCLLNLYKSLVRTRMDYGAIVYQSATPSTLKMLDPVHHLGIRLCTGAFRTSPVESLYVEANEWSLQLQRSYMSFLYYLKVNADKEHPSYFTINDLSSSALFCNRPSVRQPYSLRVRSLAEETGVPLLEQCLMAPAAHLPPWKWQLVDCDTSFVEITKHAPIAHIQTYFRELQHKYSCPEFFTDASKSNTSVTYAAVGPSFSNTGILHPSTSIFTAEAYAIFVAVEHIKQIKLQSAVIYTDSLSVVKALKSLKKHKNPVLVSLYSVLCTAYTHKQHVVVCWVPGHREIQGNVLADQLAASAHEHRPNTSAIPALDLKPFLIRKLRAFWQSTWDTRTKNKLHVIKPYLGYWPPVSKSRHKEVALTRLRIGHTYSTHGHLISGGDPPMCEKCGEPLTVLHVLIECKELDTLRRKHFPLYHRHQIPLHPSMFIGREPVFNYQSLFAFLKDVHGLQVTYPGKP